MSLKRGGAGAGRLPPPVFGATLAVLALLGCSRGAAVGARPAPTPGASPKGDEVVAEVHGRAVTLAELDARAAARLEPLRRQEYDVRREVLEELVAERLFAHEAEARGTTVEALLKAEVDDKLTPPAADQVERLYAHNRDQMGGRSLAEVRPQLEAALRQQAREARRGALRRELAAKAGVRTRLEPPRAAVAVPASAPALGPSTAPVTLVEFSDYQCPYCRRAQQTVEQLLERYPDKLRVVVRDFPLDFHGQARRAAEAAHCAGEQGRFFEYHRDLLGRPGDLSEADLKARASALKLDARRFAVCLASGRSAAVIDAGLEQGARLGVNSTPTFFVNGRPLVGARPLDQFVEAVEAELASAR